jgi:hypothetical protein
MNPLSFHDKAMPTALAVTAAGKQGKFWEYYKTLFENNQALTDDDLKKYAKDLGLNVEQWEKDRASAEVKKVVEAQQAIALALGASGTPAFFVNGQSFSGAKPFEEFKVAIDAQLAKASKLVERKVPVEALHAVLSGSAIEGKYRAFVIDGKEPPKPQTESAEGPAEPLAKAVAEIPIGDSPRKGEGDKVVITEFSDFQ